MQDRKRRKRGRREQRGKRGRGKRERGKRRGKRRGRGGGEEGERRGRGGGEEGERRGRGGGEEGERRGRGGGEGGEGGGGGNEKYLRASQIKERYLMLGSCMAALIALTLWPSDSPATPLCFGHVPHSSINPHIFISIKNKNKQMYKNI